MNNEVKKADPDSIEPNPAVDAEDGARPESAEDAQIVEAPEPAQEPVDPIEELNSKIAVLEDNLLRAKADCQNLQRRSAQERTAAVRYANAEMMRSLLDVVDDLQRSCDAAKDCPGASSLVDGIRLVYENLMKALRSYGLEEISAVRQPFDPHVHQAMIQQPSSDHPAGTVLEEIARGYRLYDRVLRPAQVIVSKAVDENNDEEPEESAKQAKDEGGKKKLWKRKK